MQTLNVLERFVPAEFSKAFDSPYFFIRNEIIIQVRCVVFRAEFDFATNSCCAFCCSR